MDRSLNVEQRALSAVAMAACTTVCSLCERADECEGGNRLTAPPDSNPIQQRAYDGGYDNERVHPDYLAHIRAMKAKYRTMLMEDDRASLHAMCVSHGSPWAMVRTDEGPVLLPAGTLRRIMWVMKSQELRGRWDWVAALIERSELFIRASGDTRAVAEVERLKKHLRNMSEYPAIREWAMKQNAIEKERFAKICVERMGG